MPAFEYVALDVRGHEKKGVIEGDNAKQIRHQLREKKWIPVEVKPIGAGGAAGASSSLSKTSISISDLTLMTRQLATLVQSSLPLEQALSAVADQTEKDNVKKTIMEVRSRVLEGNTLAVSMSSYPKIFDNLFCSTVAAGEHAGHLDVVLERLADYTEKRHAMKQSIKMALLYPAIITILSLLIVSGLLAYVVPSVVKVFTDTGQQLPALTIAMISASDWVRDYGLYALGAFFALYFGFKKLLTNENNLYKWHTFLLKLPIAKVIKSTETARFARTLSILNSSGVPLLEALKISVEVMNSLPIKNAVGDATKKVSEGTSLKIALDQTGYFPPMAIHMIASGEASGELEQMLNRVADQQESDFQNLVTAVLGMMGPLMVVVMGGMVLLIVLAILLPIFELNELVS